jgi:hypothetical protein
MTTTALSLLAVVVAGPPASPADPAVSVQDLLPFEAGALHMTEGGTRSRAPRGLE